MGTPKEEGKSPSQVYQVSIARDWTRLKQSFFFLFPYMSLSRFRFASIYMAYGLTMRCFQYHITGRYSSKNRSRHLFQIVFFSHRVSLCCSKCQFNVILLPKNLLQPCGHWYVVFHLTVIVPPQPLHLVASHNTHRTVRLRIRYLPQDIVDLYTSDTFLDLLCLRGQQDFWQS